MVIYRFLMVFNVAQIFEDYGKSGKMWPTFEVEVFGFYIMYGWFEGIQVTFTPISRLINLFTYYGLGAEGGGGEG